MTLRVLHHALPIFAGVLCFLVVLLLLASSHPFVQGHLAILAAIYRPEAMFPGH